MRYNWFCWKLCWLNSFVLYLKLEIRIFKWTIWQVILNNTVRNDYEWLWSMQKRSLGGLFSSSFTVFELCYPSELYITDNNGYDVFHRHAKHNFCSRGTINFLLVSPKEVSFPSIDQTHFNLPDYLMCLSILLSTVLQYLTGPLIN